MNSKIQHVTDDTWDDEILESESPVLVDYWAEWCGPCKMIAPILDEIADEYSDRLKIYKMDIDANVRTPQKYGVQGIPTLMLFKSGRLEASQVGVVPKKQLTAFLDQFV
ncbi:MAG: thioredoxin TrxA [Gammaproteobacteria bacterium]|nr:thioredoxin TrxA [Gammaproteobacteria bacterium]